jgi:hypothetical protein
VNTAVHLANSFGVGARVYRNIIYRCGNTALASRAAIRVHDGAEVTNNTIYGQFAGHGIEVSESVVSGSAASTVSYNIIDGIAEPGKYAVLVKRPGQAHGQGNCVSRVAAGWEFRNFTDRSAVDADPLFVSPVNNDFRTRSGSPCSTAGAYGTAAAVKRRGSAETAVVEPGAASGWHL